MMIELTNNNFKELMNSNKLVLIDFFATWCGPCKMMAPIVEELSEELKDIVVAKLDVDKESELATKFNVISIPTLVLFNNGQEKARSIGFT